MAKTMVAEAVDVRVELERIRADNDGVLTAADVVAAARHPDHPLHSKFEWDDDKAADKYRLWQARHMIINVMVLAPTGKEVRAFVSLQDDRQEDEGGYRALVDVMTNADSRKRLLSEALAEFKRWEAKYELLQELVPIFRAAKKVK